MKTYLEFKLPEEEEEYRVAMQGSRSKSVIFEMARYLRGLRKYGSKEEVSITEVEDKLYQLCEGHEVNPWE